MNYPDEAMAEGPGFALMPVQRHQGGDMRETVDFVAEETPVAMVYNGLSHAVMMASPIDLEDFALGFSLCEGIVRDAGQVREIEVVAGGDGIELRMEVANQAFHALKTRRRTLTGRTGCGLCGAESLQQAVRPLQPLASRRSPERAAIRAAMTALERSQQLRATTGAAHAAAWCSASGRIERIREDVGRHNALDKLVGAMHHHAVVDTGGFVLVSSRASYELVQKCCSAGVSTLVAVSAPTTLAIRQARALNVNLIGFARHNRHLVYHATQNEDDEPRCTPIVSTG